MCKTQILIISAMLLAACSKEPTALSDPCLAVTGYISACDSNWKVMETHVMIHWHRVCDEDLAHFKKIDGERDSSTCPGYAITWWVVGRDTCAPGVTK